MPGFFKSLLATDRVVRVFCSGRLVHPVPIQLFGLAGGYDGFWLDAEHAGISTEQITMAALVGRAVGLGSFVRMPVTNYAAVTQALESGVDGVMAAQVASADEAEKFLSWAKFAPRGVRGLNTQGADAHFTRKSQIELAHDANRDHFVAIQIETLGAIGDAVRRQQGVKGALLGAGHAPGAPDEAADGAMGGVGHGDGRGQGAHIVPAGPRLTAHPDGAPMRRC